MNPTGDEQVGGLGVLGGTFDPIHLGHLIIAQEFQHQLGLQLILFLVSSRPPHKTDLEISPDADRLEMVRLAIAGNPSFQISTVDLDREGLSYTADSLEHIAREFPGRSLHFLMGGDSLRDLPTWHDPNRIARQARLGVTHRPDVQVDLEDVLESVPDARGRLDFVDMPLIEIASRDLRRRVAQGIPIRYQVPEEVERYIAERGLYRSR